MPQAEQQGSAQKSTVATITAAAALERLALEKEKRSVPMFRHGTLELKLYGPRGTDPQTPHSRDELYVVMAGSGDFVSGNRRERFAVGDVMFAPAGVEHRFENFSDDFAVWVMFYGPEGGEAARAEAKFGE